MTKDDTCQDGHTFRINETSCLFCGTAQDPELRTVIAVRESVLQEAERIVNGDRAREYGDMVLSFTQIAKLWSVIMDKEITPEQVALCMIALKINRFNNGGGRDSLVDIGGYAACAARVAGIDAE